MSRTPRYSVGSLGRLRAKRGKQVVVRMSCVPFHTIYKTAGIVCLSEKPLGKTFRAKTKGDNSPPKSGAPAPTRSRDHAAEAATRPLASLLLLSPLLSPLHSSLGWLQTQAPDRPTAHWSCKGLLSEVASQSAFQ